VKHIDEYRDPVLARALLAAIAHLARSIRREVTLMEICGSHTQAIGRFGIGRLLPPNVRLISGPGCPVCVTSIEDVDRAILLAGKEGTIVATFGDMLKVPGTDGTSLQQARAAGADVRVIASSRDALALAEAERARAVVMLGIGFETTAPTVAAAVQAARRKRLANFFVFSLHKVIPPAIKALIEAPTLAIDGFICPGHVSTIIGTAGYALIPAAGRAAAITGFEPADILEGILIILRQVAGGEKEVAVQYSRGVNPEGNGRARALMEEVFRRTDALWRGLGNIPESGLALRDEWSAFDALKRFPLPRIASREPAGCLCGEILRGAKRPQACPLFGRLCTPGNPVGPCMVSSEGTCAAHYRYRDLA
jgi:hydrogenase expression/formation protein HypD